MDGKRNVILSMEQSRLLRGAVKAVEQVDPDNVYYAKTWQQLKEWLLLLRD